MDPQPGKNGSVGGIRTPNSPFGEVDQLAGGNLVQAAGSLPCYF
ncbi:hypothetical protein BMETH_557_0 [methanotrophic bacterial endosymbiont of Bathymodiolus sp.]|nr:hypothetical protein BMETH_557_0 [methanotrophic bacterial endosymbiont of Bathymodiolus sp.]